ncbi:hypothetical protein ACR79N_23900 [Sphingobacterium siyangense]|uniref:hypothetical protein n=1 Tax=Sphingobacterium siyangense TaxID=459529 RepID=UPI003DA4B446
MQNQRYPKNDNSDHLIMDNDYKLVADMIKKDLFGVLLKAKLICNTEMAVLTLFDNSKNFVRTYFHDVDGNIYHTTPILDNCINV